MSQPPKTRPPARRVPPRAGEAGGAASTGTGTGARSGATRPATNVNAPRRNDPFPFVLGGIIAALVLGMMLVVFLISSNQNNNTTASNTTNPTVAAGNQAPGGAPGATNAPADNTQATPEATQEPAPRMALADFKKLYDDPSKRPLIIDVRAKDAYDSGHIRGAISFPESDVDTRIAELPKDKLVVAYCQ